MILVTGAAGLSGSIVIREFLRQQQPVRALVRDRTKANWLDQLPTVEVVEGDMLRPETLGAALDGVDRTLMISTSSPQMVDTQCTFIDACKAAGVPHVVKFSGAESGIGFDPANFSFFAMHEEIERYLERSGLAWTHSRIAGSASDCVSPSSSSASHSRSASRSPPRRRDGRAAAPRVTTSSHA
jgi:uncharacterized protein YbjT (DUF2867 family)